MSNADDDWYSILQVHESAEPEVIEAAYRRLARKYHPDVNTSPNATETMQRLNDAYAVLSDPGKRSAYDDRRRGRWAEPERQEPVTPSRGEKSIELSKGRISILMCVCVAFVAVGIWIFAVDGDDPGTRLVSGTTIIFFGFGGVASLRMLLRKSPVLVLNRHGFTDNSNLMPAGFVPWSEVSRLSEIEQGIGMFLAIHVKHPQWYVGRGGVLPKMMRLANQKMYGTPIIISTNFLKISHAELVASIEEYRHAWSARGG